MQKQEDEKSKEFPSTFLSQIFSIGSNSKQLPEFSIDSPTKGLFYSACYLLECLGDEILTQWCNRVIAHLKNMIINGYAKCKWHIPTKSGAPTQEQLTPELIPAIQTLEEVTKAVTMGMSPGLSEKWVKRLATRFDEV